MATEEVIVNSAEVAGDIAAKLGSLGKWLQALGLVIVIWILVQIVTWIAHKKRNQKMYEIKQNLERIEKKIDALGKK